MEDVADEYLSIPAAETPSALTERSQIAELVREEIAKLPHDLKTVVLLFVYDNLSYAEIAVIMGCTQSRRNATLSCAETAHKEVGRDLLSR
jgi:DNA-directed RNA polymerase specialized sigma24 family protein